MTAGISNAARALDGAPQRLDRDGFAAVAMLVFSAVALHGRVSDASLLFPVFRVLWWAIYLGTAATLMRRFGGEWATWTIRRQPALCALLALTALSSLWSLAPALTLQKAASLLGTTLVGIYIGYTVPPPRLIRVLAWTFALLIAGSVVVSLALPTPTGPGVPLGWRGVMGHKNGLGAMAALAAVFFLIVAAAGRGTQPLVGAALAAISLLTLAHSNSRTAWVALAAAVVAAAWAMGATAARPSPAALRRAALCLVLAVAALPLLLGPFAEPLGDWDPLNGRADLWDGALQIVGERPLTGYGYEVVWGRHGATLLPHIAITAGRSAASAHNSIAHVATELGIVAAAVACVYLFGALINAVYLVGRAPSPFAAFALAFVVGFVVMGFTEAHLLQIHWTFWILFVAVTVAVRRRLDRPADGAFEVAR